MANSEDAGFNMEQYKKDLDAIVSEVIPDDFDPEV